MKKLIVIILVFVTSPYLFSQNIDKINKGEKVSKIYLKDGDVIKDAIIHEINKDIVVYEKHGSLHDVFIIDIKMLRSNDSVIYFDESNEVTNNKIDVNENLSPVGFIALKFAPLALLEPVQSFQASFEFSLGSGVSFQQEAGYYFNSIDLLSFDDVDYGVILKSEIRYYFEHSRVTTSNGHALNGEYFALQGFYKYIKYDNYNNYDNYGFAYGRVPMDKTVYGGHFKIGYQKIFKSGFLLDLYGGPGLRYKTKTYPDYESGPGLTAGIWWPSLTAGIKLGFAL